VKPNVSVGTIRHWMIYREHPEVGLILHVHGWIDGTVSTDVSYPCGTVQLRRRWPTWCGPPRIPTCGRHRAAQPRADDYRSQPRRHLRPRRRAIVRVPMS
jgi:hypothetical protein